MFIKNKIYLIALLVAGVMLLAFGTAPAQAAPAAPVVGVVDYLYLINGHPDTAKANEILRSEQVAANKEVADKSANLSDNDKLELRKQLEQRLEQKRLEILNPIIGKINTAVKEIADTRGLSVVIGKNTVVYGGTDITQEVLKKITEK